jgi:hypothetical protein
MNRRRFFGLSTSVVGTLLIGNTAFGRRRCRCYESQVACSCNDQRYPSVHDGNHLTAPGAGSKKRGDTEQFFGRITCRGKFVGVGGGRALRLVDDGDDDNTVFQIRQDEFGNLAHTWFKPIVLNRWVRVDYSHGLELKADVHENAVQSRTDATFRVRTRPSDRPRYFSTTIRSELAAEQAGIDWPFVWAERPGENEHDQNIYLRANRVNDAHAYAQFRIYDVR